MWTWGEFRIVSSALGGLDSLSWAAADFHRKSADTRQLVFASAKTSRLVPARSIPCFIYNKKRINALFIMWTWGESNPRLSNANAA